MAERAIYTLGLGNNDAFNTSVAYGTTSNAITATLSASFTPASSISSVEITSFAWLSTDGYFSASGTNIGSFPVTLPAIGWTGETAVIYLSCAYDNTRYHINDEQIGGGFNVTMGTATLSAGSSDTIGAPGSAAVVTSYGDYPMLSAVGDAGAPSGVTAFVATPLIGSVGFTWTLPADTDLSSIYIQVSTVCAPTAYNIGDNVYIGNGSATATTVSEGVTAGITNYFSIFSKDNVGEYSSTPIVSATGMPIINTYTNLPWAVGKSEQYVRGVFVDEGIV